jgi:hypothetical protein
MKTSFGMAVLFAFLIVASFLVEVGLVAWFCWALHDVGYADHSLDFHQSMTLALPLWVATLGAMGSQASS